MKRWDSDKQREVWSAQVGIDGFRAIAERTGVYDGQDEPDFEYDKSGKLLKCRVKVYRKDVPRPFVGVAHFSEYAQFKKDGSLTNAPERDVTPAAKPSRVEEIKSVVKAKLAAVVEAPPASPPRPSRMQIQDVEPEPQEEPPPPSEEWAPMPDEPVQASPPSDGERSKRTLVKFGRDKGKHLCDVPDLGWLKAAAKKAVEAQDEKWHSKNLEWAHLIDEELARRDS